jgi:hypothetical protein
MNTRAALKSLSGLSAALLLAVPAWGQSYEAAAYSPGNDSLASGIEDAGGEPAESGAMYARLLYFEGGISLRRPAELNLPGSQVTPNTPLVPGDEIWTGQDGRAEVQLADGAILRLDTSARLSLLSLADLDGAFDDTTLLRLPNGSLYIRASSFDAQRRRFQIDTPAGSIFLLSEGIFRVDVTSGGAATISSFRGVAEILTEGTSVIAHSGERLTATPGRVPGEARAFNTLRSDPFDAWAESRDEAIASARSGRGPDSEDVPAPVRPYVTELSHYGTWTDTPEYGWVWVPGDTDTQWRPYYYGRWTWAPIGMVWVSSEPWGYAPYHYGRWHHTAGIGWFWAPGYIYSGAYVSWSVGPFYYGWSPTGYYGYPVMGGHHSPWTYVHHSHIYHHDMSHYSYSYSDVARHRMHDNARPLRSYPRAHPGYQLERSGEASYKRAEGRKAAAPRLSRGAEQRASFRNGEYREYKRRLGRRPATGHSRSRINPGRPGGGARREPTAVHPRGSDSRPRGRTITPTGKSGFSPVSTKSRSARPRVSPVSGKPLRPSVRAIPSNSVRNKVGGRSAAPQRSRQLQPRRAASPKSTVSRPAQQKARSRVVGTRPHAKVMPSRSRGSRSPFVMVKRGKSSKSGAAGKISRGSQGRSPRSATVRSKGSPKGKAKLSSSGKKKSGKKK